MNAAIHLTHSADACASASVPFEIASGEASSSGLWLSPFRHGINTIAIGATRAMNNESWYARHIKYLCVWLKHSGVSQFHCMQGFLRVYNFCKCIGTALCLNEVLMKTRLPPELEAIVTTWVTIFCGRCGDRTCDLTRVRRTLWTSWAKRPQCIT